MFFVRQRRWPVSHNGSGRSRSERSRVQLSAGPLPGDSLGQAAHTHVPLSPSGIIWYRPMVGNALQMGK